MSSNIIFIGGGAGAADLMTVRGMNALKKAQVVLYDALIDREILTYAPSSAILVNVGKRAAHCEAKKQAQINQLLIQYGLQYDCVVRLKGGDPSVFGRLDEEIDAIQSVGLSFEIIPGVSSAFAAAASAQTALTKRGVARSVRLLTATTGGQQPENHWYQDISTNETLVFYMSRAQRTLIASTLLKKDFPADTPVIIVYGASWHNEVIHRMTLSQMMEPNDCATDAPCICLIGEALRTAVQANQTSPSFDPLFKAAS